MLPKHRVRQLLAMGVPLDAIKAEPMLAVCKCSINDNLARIEPLYSSHGTYCIMLPIQRGPHVVDWAAWNTHTGQCAPLCRNSFAVGDLDKPAPIHDTPLEWLKANRVGIVLLKKRAGARPAVVREETSLV